MITAICLCWIGVRLEAPTWYFIILAISLCMRHVNALIGARFQRKVREHLREMR